MDDDIVQRFHEMRSALEVEKRLRLDCEDEVTRLIEENNRLKEQVTTVSREAQESMRNLRETSRTQQEDLAAELQSLQNRIDEMGKTVKEEASTQENKEEDHLKLTDEIILLKQQLKDFSEDNERMKLLRDSATHEIVSLQNLVVETKRSYEQAMDALKVKAEELAAINVALEEAREEKMIMKTELMCMQSAEKTDARGNSLFKEVADDRSKIVDAYKSLKKKYSVVKNAMVAKNNELHSLKCEVSRLKLKLCEDSKDVDQIICKYAAGLHHRVQELEAQVHDLAKRKESPEIVTISENDVSNLDWVHLIVDEARKDARKAFEDLQKISQESAKKSLDLRNAELDNRNLIMKCKRLECQIENLEKKIASMENNEALSNPRTRAVTNRGQEETTFEPAHGNKTVRFSDDIEETVCAS